MWEKEHASNKNKTKVNKEYKNKNEIMQNMSPIIWN